MLLRKFLTRDRSSEQADLPTLAAGGVFHRKGRPEARLLVDISHMAL